MEELLRRLALQGWQSSCGLSRGGLQGVRMDVSGMLGRQESQQDFVVPCGASKSRQSGISSKVALGNQ